MQHLAAKNGHLEIYKFLHENSNEINPFMQESITPLHLAAQHGHFEVCKYICDNTAFVAPPRSDMNTPLTLAFHRGHIKIARMLFERNLGPIGPWDMLIMLLQLFLLFLINLLCFIGITIFDDFVFYPLFFQLTFYHTRYKIKDIMFCFWTSPKLDY